MSTDNSVESGEVVDSESARMSPVTPRSNVNDSALDGQKNDGANETMKGNSALVSLQHEPNSLLAREPFVARNNYAHTTDKLCC